MEVHTVAFTVFEKITVGNKTYKLIKEGENTDLNLGMTTTQAIESPVGKQLRNKEEDDMAKANIMPNAEGGEKTPGSSVSNEIKDVDDTKDTTDYTDVTSD